MTSCNLCSKHTPTTSGPDSLVVRASASGAVGRGFAPRPRHTKALTMVLVAPLLTLATKGNIQESRWVFVTCYVAVKALQSLGCMFQNATLNKASLSLSLSYKHARVNYTPLLYSKTGVYRGIHYFLVFALKHRLLVLVRTASMSNHNLCFLAKLRKISHFFSSDIFHFYSREKSQYRHVIVMILPGLCKQLIVSL